jgi:hypothetical protein
LILQIRISDDLYQHYANRAPLAPQKELEKALEAFKDLDPREVRVVVAGADLKALSAILGHPISTPAELLEHLQRSQRVALPEEGVEVQLSSPQRARLKAQANFMSKAVPAVATPEEYKAFVVQQVKAGIAQVVGA